MLRKPPAIMCKINNFGKNYRLNHGVLAAWLDLVGNLIQAGPAGREIRAGAMTPFFAKLTTVCFAFGSMAGENLIHFFFTSEIQ